MMNRCHGLSFHNIILDLLINHVTLFAASTEPSVHKSALPYLLNFPQNSNPNFKCMQDGYCFERRDDDINI
jgi:hypothetical protein